jgi:hypothetical protein
MTEVSVGQGSDTGTVQSRVVACACGGTSEAPTAT